MSLRPCQHSILNGAFLLDGELVGVVAFNNIEKMNRCATIGYWVAKSKMGRGYMTAAVKALIDDGFQHLELNRIQARVATATTKSGRFGPVRSKERRRIAPS